MTNLTSKYEQHAKLYRQGLEDASRNFEFLNNPSFTVPNGESGYWKTNLARYRR